MQPNSASLSIKQPEGPQRYADSVTVLNIVLHDMAVVDRIYLLLALALAAHLESVVSDDEIRHTRRDDVADNSRLIKEEGLAQVAFVGAVRLENVHHVGVVKIDLLHLSETSHPTRLVA